MNWNLVNKVRRFLRTSWIKSAYLNFSMLPFQQAIHFPIVVSRYTYFYSLSGKIRLISPARFGMCRIGYLGEDVEAPKNKRALLQIEGLFNIGDNVRLGVGSIIRVEENAVLTFNQNVRIGANCRIVCYHKISLGQNTGVSWECQIIDSNMHPMRDLVSGKSIPMNKPISIGENNWIGTRSSVMKGAQTPDYTIIAAGSLVNKRFDMPERSIIAGVPAKLVKSGVIRCPENN